MLFEWEKNVGFILLQFGMWGLHFLSAATDKLSPQFFNMQFLSVQTCIDVILLS